MIKWYKYWWLWFYAPKSALLIYRNNDKIKWMQEELVRINEWAEENHRINVEYAAKERALIDAAMEKQRANS